MSNGRERFEFYLVKMEALFALAAADKNPALWLYTNNARTLLFMLESLAKLYAGLHNKKKFRKIQAHVKLLEDTIGAIDYYDGFAKEFVQNTAIPVTITGYLQAQTREKIQSLNEILIKEKWLGEKAGRLKKIRKKLDKADWLEPEEEVTGIMNFYKASIEEIKVLMLIADKGFTEIENQVHKLRRDLRWLSIYPQALQGIVQFTDSNVNDETLKSYLIPEIVNSPFNKMPAAGINTIFLLLEKNYFLALSWMIAELGKLKDNGLRIIVTTEALQQTQALPHNEAMATAFQVLGDDPATFQKILDDASAITKRYSGEHNLDKLLHGVGKAGS